MTAQRVVELMRVVEPNGNYLTDQPLTECGLDSLGLATVLSMVDAECEINLFEQGIEWARLQTVGDFVEVCCVSV